MSIGCTNRSVARRRFGRGRRVLRQRRRPAAQAQPAPARRARATVPLADRPCRLAHRSCARRPTSRCLTWSASASTAASAREERQPDDARADRGRAAARASWSTRSPTTRSYGCRGGSVRTCCSTFAGTLFAHVQELSLSFYERYTSGRIISRLTSDIDALNELLATGLTSVITSLISVVAITVILLHLDTRLGLVTLVAMPLVLAHDRVVPQQLRPLVSRRAARDRARDRALRRVAGRDPRRARVPPRAAQPGDLRRRQRPLPRRQHLVEPARVDIRARRSTCSAA